MGGRIAGRVAKLPQNTLKIEKTPDFGHSFSNLGGGGGGVDLPGFQKFGGQDPVGDAPGGTRLPAVKSWKGTSPKIPRMKWPKCAVFSDF